MPVVSIGAQNFEALRMQGAFYIDKTAFIKEWWESLDQVTLITRPRRFGKTLNMDMLATFFSVSFAGRSELFDGLSIWEEKKYRDLQGTCPVIFLSFAAVKEKSAREAVLKIGLLIQQIYRQNDFLLQSDYLSESEKTRLKDFDRDISDLTETEITFSLNYLCELLYRHFGKKILVLLDEYDTPLQEAWLDGYWDEMLAFYRNLFNATFKTNPYMERALLTGITRVSKESIFSDLNNPNIVTTTSFQYESVFGFTQEEVFRALEDFGLSDQKEQVKRWYDGFTFGNRSDIYNPWSITNFLKNRVFKPYWADTSSNRLISDLVQTGDPEVKEILQDLLEGKSLQSRISEEIVFADLDIGTKPLWSLLLASGYLKVVSVKQDPDDFESGPVYTLKLTNGEVRLMFANMIRRWFEPAGRANNAFIRAMISGDELEMNRYMNDIALMTISSFDSGKKPSVSSTPEKFYHGFVLGLMVEERKNYLVKSNRESGYGRYDVCMIPKRPGLPGIIMEFKVIDREYAKEEDLNDTAESALRQIREKKYDVSLKEQGISNIHSYGFAFEGKRVLIKSNKDFQECGSR